MIRTEQARALVQAAVEAIEADAATAAEAIYSSEAEFEGPIGGPSLRDLLESIETPEFVLGSIGVDSGRAAFDFAVRGRDALDIARKVGHGHVWWWFDADGRVAREIHRIPWETRRIDGTEPGSVVALSGDSGSPGAAAELALEPLDESPARRSPAWYREFRDRIEELAGWDPVLAVESFCSEGVVIGSPDLPATDIVGRDALRGFAEELVELVPRHRRVPKVIDMLSDVDAIHLNLGYIYSPPRPEAQLSDSVTIVMAIERDGRLRSCRLYGPWRGETLPTS